MAPMSADRPRRVVRLPRERDEAGRPANARPRDRFGRPLPRGAVDEMAQREEPEAVVATTAEAFARAVALFDAARFFEAHEFLEWIWKHDDHGEAAADRRFWKGVTQVAVACVHVQRDNPAGALTLLDRARAALDGYPDHHRGVDRAALVAVADALAATVRAEGAHPGLDFPRFPRA